MKDAPSNRLAGQRRYQQDYAAGRVGSQVHSRSGKDLPPHRPRAVFDREQLRKLAAAKLSVRAIAKQLGVSRQTVQRELNQEAQK